MDFANTLRLIEEDPLRYIDSECALSLGAFLFGYKSVDTSAGHAITELLDRIPGPAQADGCTRAYLAFGGGPSAFRKALHELQEIAQAAPVAPQAGPLAHIPFMESVRDAIVSGRIGLALAEPTVVWLANYYRGSLTGLHSVSPSDGAEATTALEQFEKWLQKRYRQPAGSWFGLIRVFEGATERGLRRFVELWDEFESVSK